MQVFLPIKATAIIAAFSIFLMWTLSTYYLEGRSSTLKRPGMTTNRLVYTGIANIAIGIVGSICLLKFFLYGPLIFDPRLFGVASTKQILASLFIGFCLGILFFFTQSFPSRHPILIINVYSQVLVVSIAEILVCYSLVGGSIANSGKSPFFVILAVVVSASLFGLYHFAHSPPFNTVKMVLMLSSIGIVTGAFFFMTRSFYGTILFHNFMGTKGVITALEANNQLDQYKKPQVSILLCAIFSVALLFLLDRFYLREATGF